MQTKIIFASIFLASLLLLGSAVFAQEFGINSVYVRPAKLGIIRLTTQPLFPTAYQGIFEVGESYNFSLDVALSATDNVSSIFSLSDTNFTLAPNETRVVSFTIKPTNPGVYQGYVNIAFSAGVNRTTVVLQPDITVIVSQSNSYILVLAAIAIVAVIVIASVFVMSKRKARGKK